MFKLTSLSNKLRVLTIPMDGVESVTALIMVGTGSRNETSKINGISHFLEHMFFKGTTKRPSAQDISSVIDGIGGEFNAFTSKEYTGLYVKAAKKHLELSLDVLSDMLLHSKFDGAEIEKEKGVIVEEINLYEDTPMRRISDVFETLLYGDQPLGWRVLGTKEVIRSLEREDFVKYVGSLYGARNVIFGVAGGIKGGEGEDLAVKLADRYLGELKNEDASKYLSVEDKECQSPVLLHFKDTDQAHLCLGMKAFGIEHPDRYTLSVLSTILGGNMSSRLFIQIREKRGLAYYVRSGADHYEDTGYFVTQAGLDIKRVDDAVKVILEEYTKVREEGDVSGEELNKAKEYIKGKMVLELEDSQSVAGLYVSQALLEKKIKTPEEIMAKIDAVTSSDIARVARDIFKDRELRLAIIGPFNDGQRFEKLLRLS